MATQAELHELAESILELHLNSDIEYSLVYEDEDVEAEELTDDEVRQVYSYMVEAQKTITFTMPPVKDDDE